MYRLKLLQYLDRLSTYEVILGGLHIAHEEYSHTFFERFRELNIIQAAVEYARVCLLYTALYDHFSDLLKQLCEIFLQSAGKPYWQTIKI